MKYADNDVVIIRRSIVVGIGSVIAATFFSLLASLSFSRGESFPIVIAFLAVIVFVIVGTVSLADRRAKIVIDNLGITINGMEKIGWNDVRSVRQESWVRGPTLVILEMQNPNHKDIKITVNGLDRSPGEIYRLISLHIDDGNTGVTSDKH